MSKTIYVCGACGKTAKKTIDFKDVSCAINATLCLENSLKYDKSGLVVYADTAPKEEKQ